MLDNDTVNTICNEVEAIFLKHAGKLSAWDIDAVFSPLRSKATGEARKSSPKVHAKSIGADLCCINLEYALEAYDWTGYAPAVTPDGNSIADFILLDADGNPPPGYKWEPTRRVLRKTE